MNPQTQEILRQARAAAPALVDVSDDVLVEALGNVYPETTRYAGFKGDFLRGELSRSGTARSQAAVAKESGVGVMGPLEQIDASIQSGTKRMQAAFANLGADVIGSDTAKALLATRGKYTGAFEEASDAIQEWSDAQSEEASFLARTRDLSEPGYVQTAANLVAESLPSLAPAVVAGPAGMPAVLAATGITSYASVADSVEREMMGMGASRKEAEAIAHAEGATAGLATTLITAGFNKYFPGLEGVLAAGPKREAARQTIKSALKAFGVSAASEAAEESLDELSQNILAEMVRSPERDMVDILKDVGAAGFVGGFFGGGFKLSSLGVDAYRSGDIKRWQSARKAKGPDATIQTSFTPGEGQGVADMRLGSAFTTRPEDLPVDPVTEGTFEGSSTEGVSEPAPKDQAEVRPTEGTFTGSVSVSEPVSVDKPESGELRQTEFEGVRDKRTEAPSKEEELADLEKQGLAARQEIEKRQAKEWKQNQLDTRGEEVYYHGVAKPFTIAKGMEDAGSELNLFGGGLYLTDDLYTASTYQGKNKAKAFNPWEPSTRKPAPGEQVGVVYEVEFDTDDVKFYDLDAEASPEVISYFKDSFDQDLVGDVEESGGLDGRSLGELIREAQGFSPELDIPAYEIQEMISGVKDALKRDGYRGFSHKGGLLTGNKKRTHDVKILWTDDISTPIYQEAVDLSERIREPGAAQVVEETGTQENLFPSSVISAIEAEGASVRASESVDRVRQLTQGLEEQLRVLSKIQTTAEQLESLAEGDTVRSAREQSTLARSSERQQKAVVKKIRNQIKKLSDALLDTAVEEVAAASAGSDVVAEAAEAFGSSEALLPSSSMLSVTDAEIEAVASKLDSLSDGDGKVSFGLGAFGEPGETVSNLLRRVFFKDTSTGALRWDPTKMRTFTRKAYRFYNGTTAPPQVREARDKAMFDRASLEDMASRIVARVDEELEKLPGESKAEGLKQANDFLLGKEEAEQGLLTEDTKDVLRAARLFLDNLSNSIVDMGLLGKDLSETIGANIGKYLLRSYKMYDPDANWNWDTIPEGIKQNARQWVIAEAESIAGEGKKGRGNIKDVVDALPDKMGPDWVDVVSAVIKGESETELQQRVDHLLSRIVPGQDAVDAQDNADWLMGHSNKGQSPVASFTKRKEIVEPIRDLMGEIRDPIVNLVSTTERLSKIRQRYDEQLNAVEVGLKTGFFKKGDDGKIAGWRPLVSNKDLALRGLKDIYAPAGLDTYVLDYLSGKDQETSQLLMGLRKAVGLGKFSQVILSPATWATSGLGAFGSSFGAGQLLAFHSEGSRMKMYHPVSRVVKDAVKKNKKRSQRADTTEKRAALAQESAKDFLENNGVDRIFEDPGLIEDLAREYGALEEGIMTRELLNQGELTMETLEDKLGVGPGPKSRLKLLKRGMDKASKWYGAADRVVTKQGGFLTELVTYAQAKPEASMGEIFQTAADIIRNVTPTPSKVPQGVRKLVAAGALPTYLTFQWENYRNTYNAFSLAQQEIKSGNPVLQRNGILRLGSITTALFAATNVLGSVLSALADWLFRDEGESDADQLRGFGKEPLQKRESLRELAPYFHQDEGMAFLSYKEGEEFTYMVSSYALAQSSVGSVVALPASILKLKGAGAVGEAAAQAMNTVASQLTGLGILSKSMIEIALNSKQDAKGTVFNPELGYLKANEGAISKVYNDVYRPGVLKSLEKATAERSVNYYGTISEPTDELLKALGVRIVRIEIPRSVKANMGSFDRRLRAAKMIYSDKPDSNRNTPERKEESEQSVAAVVRDYKSFMEDMQHLLPDSELRKFEKNYNEGTASGKNAVAKDLRKSW